MPPSPLDDEFWRRHDHILGVAPVSPTEITNRIPVVSPTVEASATATPKLVEADIDVLRREVDDTIRRAVEIEIRNAERDDALRTVVQTFERQLADMEAEHPRRLDAIRLGAEAAAERILTEARKRAAALLADHDLPARGADDHVV